MKIWLLSDLHTEFRSFEFSDPPPAADVCVVAGDICDCGPLRGIELLKALAGHMPVICVAGNHDFYRGSFSDGLREARALIPPPGVHFLENNAVVIGDLTFIGCTLWTDMALHGTPEVSMYECGRTMNDYRKIKFSKVPYRKLSPILTVRAHIDSRAFIERAFEAMTTRRSVVVTHHAPSVHSIPQHFRSDATSPAYASDLEELIARTRPDLWLHGHVHEACNYRIDDTRVICNPRGYPGEQTGFDPRMVVEI